MMALMVYTPTRRWLQLRAPVPMGRFAIITSLGLLLVPALVHGHETDQFTIPPGREFADIADELTAWAYGAIERGVEKVNRRIEQAVKSGASGERLAELQSGDELVRAVNGEFPWAMEVIEGWEKALHSRAVQRRYPGKLVAYKESLTNIYQGAHLPIDPRQFFRLYLASTIRVGDVYMGTDRLATSRTWACATGAITAARSAPARANRTP